MFATCTAVYVSIPLLFSVSANLITSSGYQTSDLKFTGFIEALGNPANLSNCFCVSTYVEGITPSPYYFRYNHNWYCMYI